MAISWVGLQADPSKVSISLKQRPGRHIIHYWKGLAVIFIPETKMYSKIISNLQIVVSGPGGCDQCKLTCLYFFNVNCGKMSRIPPCAICINVFIQCFHNSVKCELREG